MLNKTTEKVFCTLKYEANDNPKCRILVDGKVAHDFIAAFFYLFFYHLYYSTWFEYLSR